MGVPAPLNLYRVVWHLYSFWRWYFILLYCISFCLYFISLQHFIITTHSSCVLAKANDLLADPELWSFLYSLHLPPSPVKALSALIPLPLPPACLGSRHHAPPRACGVRFGACHCSPAPTLQEPMPSPETPICGPQLQSRTKPPRTSAFSSALRVLGPVLCYFLGLRGSNENDRCEHHLWTEAPAVCEQV